MKTSMAYRLFRLYFNANSDNHELFGNRVHSPLNELEVAQQKAAEAAWVRTGMIALIMAALVLISIL